MARAAARTTESDGNTDAVVPGSPPLACHAARDMPHSGGAGMRGAYGHYIVAAQACSKRPLRYNTVPPRRNKELLTRDGRRGAPDRVVVDGRLARALACLA